MNTGVVIMCVVGFIAFTIAFVVFAKSSEKMEKELLQQKKNYQDRINEINARYCFHMDLKDKYDFEYVFNDSEKANKYKIRQLMQFVVSEHKDEFELLIREERENNELYITYMDEVNMFMETSEDKAIENFEDLLLHPVLEVDYVLNIILSLRYADYNVIDAKTFYYNEIIEMLDEIKKGVVISQEKELQRKLVTDSLRYDILKRDNFRCVLCGRNVDDGVKLHVDHIIPVAKGGKTEESNLRTLCNECNQGKSDKYDVNGVN